MRTILQKRVISNINLNTTNLKFNNKVEIKKQSVNLEERIKKYKGPNLAKEFSWDEPKGKEIF